MDRYLDTGHGTHVAGSIAAVNGNGKGVCGIAGGDGTANSGVKIMSCQVFAGQGGVTLSAEAQAIKYAADNGAVILQCSWGYNSADANAIDGLYRARQPRQNGPSSIRWKKKPWITSSTMQVLPME